MNRLKTIIKLFTIHLCIFFSALSCEKNPFDKRRKFIGEYTFTINKRGINTISNIPIDTVYTKKGKIEYNEDRDKVSIFFLEYLIDEPTLYEDWSIIGNKIKGEFNTTNTLKFHYSRSGLGNSIFTNVEGEKTK